MSGTVFMSLASLFFIIIIMISYFSKERNNSSETKIFTKLLIVSFCSLLTELYLVIIPRSMEFLLFVLGLRLLLIFCFIWITYFMEYVFIVTRNNKDKVLIDYKKKYNKLYKIYWTISFIIIFLVIILPIDYYQSINVKYSYGPSVDLVFGLTGIYTFIMSLYIIKNYKNLKNRGYLPIIALVLLLMIMGLIQKSNPGILLANTCFALITSLIYHTIENPDIKLLKDYFYTKKEALTTINYTNKTLDKVYNNLKDSIDKLTEFGYKEIKYNDIDDLNNQIKEIQNESINISDNIVNVLDFYKINVINYSKNNEKYDSKDMIEELNELFKNEIFYKDLNVYLSVTEKINPILYGDKEKTKELALYLFKYLVDIIQEGDIEISIENINVGRFCRLKFIYIINDDKIEEHLVKNNIINNYKFKDNPNNFNYLIINKLLNILEGNIKIEKVDNSYRVILSIEQKNMSDNEIYKEEIKNINKKIDYIDCSDKRILLIDDNRTKIKELMLLLKPYFVQIDVVNNKKEMYKKLSSNKSYDLILLDDIIPNFNNEKNILLERNKSLKENIKSSSGYNIPIILMNSDNDNVIEEVDDYLEKPIDKVKLDKIITKYLK